MKELFIKDIISYSEESQEFQPLLSPVKSDNQQLLKVSQELEVSEMSDMNENDSAHAFSDGSNFETESIDSFGWNTIQRGR